MIRLYSKIIFCYKKEKQGADGWCTSAGAPLCRVGELRSRFNISACSIMFGNWNASKRQKQGSCFIKANHYNRQVWTTGCPSPSLPAEWSTIRISTRLSDVRRLLTNLDIASHLPLLPLLPFFTSSCPNRAQSKGIALDLHFANGFWNLQKYSLSLRLGTACENRRTSCTIFERICLERKKKLLGRQKQAFPNIKIWEFIYNSDHDSLKHF